MCKASCVFNFNYGYDYLCCKANGCEPQTKMNILSENSTSIPNSEKSLFLLC
jgi:hypothetical protein